MDKQRSLNDLSNLHPVRYALDHYFLPTQQFAKEILLYGVRVTQLGSQFRLIDKLLWLIRTLKQRLHLQSNYKRYNCIIKH